MLQLCFNTFLPTPYCLNQGKSEKNMLLEEQRKKTEQQKKKKKEMNQVAIGTILLSKQRRRK